MISAKRLHKFVLQSVNILKLVYHYIFKAFLPFQAYVLVLRKNIQREFDKVVIIKPKAFLFLIKIAVKDYIILFFSIHIFFVQSVKGHIRHIKVIFGLFE